jgi:DNA-binding NarL/FixJ family response regulator
VARERIGEHTSLDDFEGDPQRAFYKVFADRRWRWPIVDVVGAKLDWESFINRFDRRDQQIVEMKLNGHAQIEIAAELGVSPAFVCQRLRALRQRWDARAVA